ncbi:MAG: PQQ-dependent sugar dehydrogenase [Chitinophagaceae bacterium]
MKKFYTLFSLLLFIFSAATFAQTVGPGSRMNEIFQKTDLIPAASGLFDPWEITYGPDDSLWVTEAKGYKVYKISTVTGAKRMILDISQNSTFLPLADRPFNLQFNFSGQGNPQGGLAGLVIHPDFMDVVTPKKYVFLSYIHSYVTTVTTPANGGVIFTNSVVRFTYNTVNGRLESPLAVCDTLPGSSDHNSQRMIIAPVNGTDYLFYAAGDMGAGQFGNAYRANKAQDSVSYEGKILRFNVEPDADANPSDKWIPNDNPFNTTTPAKQNAVWVNGIRNNQGFAFARINNTDFLYGSSHGPFSDDEINIIEKSRNYGHPRVIGYSADGNYNNAKASLAASSLPLIYNEAMYASDTIGAGYRDPVYSFYPAPKGSNGVGGSIQNIYINNPGNAGWPSEAPSGMDIYTNSKIPGWKNALLLGSLKGGKVIRMKLNSTGDDIMPNPNDTINYFRSTNRFRDIAISPDGNSIFTIIDKSSTTSGPTTGNPIISACAGCVQKYTFLGYAAASGTSTIPSVIPIGGGKPNICEDANTITINAANANYWVPVTDTNSNVIAEINANGNILGNVYTSLYTNTGAVREEPISKTLYLNRNITITPQTQPSSPVSVRLYLSNAEFTALKTATNSMSQPSNVNSIANLCIYKNSDACGATLMVTPQQIATSHQSAFGAGGYVLQGNISSFSTFYFANILSLLPVRLLSFAGALSNDIGKLYWATEDEKNTTSFTVERSTNARDFFAIGSVQAIVNKGKSQYAYNDSALSILSTQAVYYRLKLTDAGAAYRYSNVIVLYPGKYKAAMSVHPNPVISAATVQISAVIAGKANWQLTDIAGKIVLQQSVTLVKGNNTIVIHLDKFPAGTYYLKLLGNSINQAVKLQKLKP